MNMIDFDPREKTSNFINILIIDARQVYKIVMYSYSYWSFRKRNEPFDFVRLRGEYVYANRIF